MFFDIFSDFIIIEKYFFTINGNPTNQLPAHRYTLDKNVGTHSIGI